MLEPRKWNHYAFEINGLAVPPWNTDIDMKKSMPTDISGPIQHTKQTNITFLHKFF